MIPLDTYWCENRPTLEDIKQAYEIVGIGKVVKICWFFPYSGHYDRIITKGVLEQYPTPEVFFEECLPKTYPV